MPVHAWGVKARVPRRGLWKASLPLEPVFTSNLVFTACDAWRVTVKVHWTTSSQLINHSKYSNFATGLANFRTLWPICMTKSKISSFYKPCDTWCEHFVIIVQYTTGWCCMRMNPSYMYKKINIRFDKRIYSYATGWCWMRMNLHIK